MNVTFFVIVILATVAAWQDWKTRTIPNGVTVGGICAGFLLAWIHGTVFMALIGFLSACTLLIPYAKGWLGGGDVKLLMAFGTLLGPWHLLDLWVGAALLSIPLAMVLAYRNQCSLRSVGIPYAVPLAISAFWIVGKGSLM